MRRQLIFGIATAASLSVAIGAQTPQSGGQADRASQSVTLTGCLQPADRSPATAGTSGGDTTSRQNSQRGPLILTNASVANRSPSGTAGTGSATGTAGSTSSSTPTGSATRQAGPTTYRILGGDDQNLHQYVNSQVEIVGTLDDAAARGTATGTSASGTERTGAAASSSTTSLPAVRVTSVRQISDSCSG
jgi:hypothetical protein